MLTILRRIKEMFALHACMLACLGFQWQHFPGSCPLDTTVLTQPPRPRLGRRVTSA